MVSCTCSLWLKISSRALNLWSCKYSEKQETCMPKNEKGKPSLFLLLGHVNSTPAALLQNKGRWCFTLIFCNGNSSNTVISHRFTWLPWAAGAGPLRKDLLSAKLSFPLSAGLA